MNKLIQIVLAGGAMLVASTAMAQSTRFYLKGDVGGTLTARAHVEELFGPVAPGDRVTFDPGVRFSIVGGFRVTDWFSTEVEGGIMASHIDSIDGASSDADFANIPLMANLRFQCPMLCWVTPYFGGGIGVSSAIFDGSVTVPGTTPGSAVRISGNDYDNVFAYQVFAGLRFAINEQMGVTLEYHYFGTQEPQWRGDTFGLTTSDRLRFGGIQTHAISAGFEYRF